MAMIERKGTFEGRVISSGFGLSGASQTEQILIGLEDKESGDTITAFLSVSEKAWKHTEKKLRACGWDAKARNFYFEELNGEESPIIGNDAQFTVDPDEYEGKTTYKVGWINPAGSVGTMERMPEDEAKNFAAKLRQRLGVSGATPPMAYQRPAAAAPREPEPWERN